MNKLKNAFLSICLLFVSECMQAQTNQMTNEPTDFMRSEGKIYVVMVVVLTILSGLLIYVFSLDKKLSKLEKKNTD